jgi:small-conductance mechanosensitive channel
VRNKRLKPEQVMVFLSKEVAEKEEQRDTMVGEYIHHKDRLYVKACQNREVFSYEFEIQSTEHQINDQLKVIKYTLELIDDQQEILQTLHAAHPMREKMLFVYCRNEALSEENSPPMQACCL